MIIPAPPPSILIFKEQMSFVEKWDFEYRVHRK